jgi:hypothetical protein
MDVGFALSDGLQTGQLTPRVHATSDGVDVLLPGGVDVGLPPGGVDVLLPPPHAALQDESEPYCAPDGTDEHASLTQS